MRTLLLNKLYTQIKSDFKNAFCFHKQIITESTMSIAAQFDKLKCCVIIPTYNNEQTLTKVISDVSRGPLEDIGSLTTCTRAN